MKQLKYLILIGLMLFTTTSIHADDFKWKQKGDKIALFRKPYKGKWQQMTGYIYDDYRISYWGKYNPDWHSYTTKVVSVQTDEGIGMINENGHTIIPCKYSTLEPYIVDDKKSEFMVVAKFRSGKKHLYYFDKSYSVKQLSGEYDDIKFGNTEKGSVVFNEEIFLIKDGKLGKVHWDKGNKIFEHRLQCEYTEVKTDSILLLNLCNKEYKWERIKKSSNFTILGKNEKYGVYSGNEFIIPAQYDLESFTVPEWTGFKGVKGKSLIQVEFLDNDNTVGTYYVLQRDGERCILDKQYREIFTHKLPKDKVMPFDLFLDGLGGILYTSRDEEKWFFIMPEENIQVNCRDDLAMKRPFIVMPEKEYSYWLMDNKDGKLGLYNSNIDKMILPAQYKSIDLPQRLTEVFTVTDTLGNKHKAFITHDGTEVVIFDRANDLLKKAKVVKKTSKYNILEYKGGYGLQNIADNNITSLNYTSITTLGDAYTNIPPEFKELLLTKRGNKLGLVGNTYMFNCVYDNISVCDTMITLTYKDWYSIHENSNKRRFFVTPIRIPEYKQYLKIGVSGQEVIESNLFSSVLKWGDNEALKEEIKTLAFHFRDNNLLNGYQLGLASWHVEKMNFTKAIEIYQSVKSKMGEQAANIENIIEMVKQLQAEKEERERWEAQQREYERQLAEEKKRQEEYERQRQYIAQQQAAEAERQRKQQAMIQLAEALGNLAQNVNAAVQRRYNPNYQQASTQSVNSSQQYNKQLSDVNRAELNDAKRYYNEWVERAKREINIYIEADVKLKVPGISQSTIKHEQQRRSRARSYLKDSCLKMMRAYRNRAAHLGGNIPISKTELQVEALLR